MKVFKITPSQIKKVRNPLPVPTICPTCGGTVSLVHTNVIFGRECWDWPFAYLCDHRACDTYVGIHPKTDIPLGTMANRPTRLARKAAKEAFKDMWEVQGINRQAAYRWLGSKMGIANIDHVHIGWFDIEKCNRVIEICKANKKA